MFRNELYVSDETYDSLDSCIDAAASKSEDLFSILNLARGQPPRKKQRVKHLKTIMYVRFNARQGKAKPITLKCLLDTGASASLIAAKHSTLQPSTPLSYAARSYRVLNQYGLLLLEIWKQRRGANAPL